MQNLKRFPDAIAANMARASLAQHGIDSFVADEMLANSDPRAVFASGGVRLMVADDEVNEAAGILLALSEADLSGSNFESKVGDITESEVSGPPCYKEFFSQSVKFRWLVLVSLAVWLVVQLLMRLF